MYRQMVFVSLMVAACVAVAATAVLADEVCDRGFQSPTSEEEQAMQAVIDSALSALPAQVEGWTAYTQDGLSIDSQCMDDPPRPWESSTYRVFERTDDLARRDAIAEDASAQYQAHLQTSQPAMDAIMARIQELAAEAMAAGEVGDFDKVDKINLEIEKASAEYEKLMQGDGALASLDAAGEEVSRDRKIRIDVAVNPGWEMLGYEARSMPAPVGGSQAFRWADTRSGPHDETALVLFGPWHKNDDSYDAAPRTGVAQTVTQTLSVTVTADTTRLDTVLAGIDFGALEALVAR